jgi:hypothetical protein
MYLQYLGASLCCNLGSVARFLLIQHTKTGKNTKYIKWTQNILNGRKINQVAMKYTNIFYSRPSKIFPNWDFWFENMPSGNGNPETKCLVKYT